MRVVAADSGAATLNDRFEPLLVVAVSAVVVGPPYREAGSYLVEPIFVKVEKGPLLIIRELELCQKLLKEERADVVHLDLSLGGLSVGELSPVSLSEMRISCKGRKGILRILPRIRKVASDIKRVHGVEVLAIRKKSVPVRIAELTSGAHAILYSSRKVVQEGEKVRLGLPMRCQPRFSKEGVALHSLVPAEHEVAGYAKDEDKILEGIQISEMLNPCLRGFRVVEITPKQS